MTLLLIVAALAVGLAAGYALGRARPRSPDSQERAPIVPDRTDAVPAGGADPERQRLVDELDAARAETARYRQLVIDIENNTPLPLLGPGAPDDLKLIVGVGPVLERMLHQLGVATFRQVAYWSDHDIDVIDAKLHGNILQRVDREIRPPIGHRRLELLDEEPLAPNVGERPLLHLVALRREAEQLDLAARMERRETRANVLGLPQGERRLPRGDREAAWR